MFGKRFYLFLTLLSFMPFAQAQIGNFTLNVTPTNESCPANGSLSFTVSNTTPGATILYSVYLLPNITAPISVQSATTISGLTAGTYRVVATQSLGSETGSQQQDATITNSIVLLTYQTTSTNEICGNDGTITINATTGTAVSYEIISGPMTRPLQLSNIFTGLTAGVYQIRVIDNCGQAVVQTYTLFKKDTNLNVVSITPSRANCIMATIGATFQPVLSSGMIVYPVQVAIVYSPPTGPPVTYNQTLTNGNGFSQLVQYYPGQTSTYTFTITDGCGTVYHLNGVIENLPPIGEPSYTVAPQDCIFQLIHFMHVASLVLVSAPAGYTATLPLSFTSSIVNQEVNVRDVVPGTYVFNLVDACGNPQTVTVTIGPNTSTPNPPFYRLYNQTCTDATLYIFDINQLTMVSAPPSYTIALPHDFSSLINSAHYAVFVHLPAGTYIFDVLDRCGNPQSMTVIIAPLSLTPGFPVLEGCEDGVGSLQLSGDLVTVSITSAPATYTGTVPADLTASLLANGTKLSMDNLPPGVYTFQSTDSCGGAFTTTVTISGYQDNTNVVITPNCGSFNLFLNHTSNNMPLYNTLYLQKLNPLTGSWGHPLTGSLYTEGFLPNVTNSIELPNNATSYNLAFTGHFRILKVFETFASGNVARVLCFRVVHEFDFSNVPVIIDVLPVSCGTTFEVVVSAQGNSALTYRIIAKNGLPFLVDNGSSNLFTSLEPANYTFEVEDTCHNSANSQFQVLNPTPMVITASSVCDGQNASLTVTNFPFLSYQWWKGSSTTTILSTINVLNFPSFNSASDNGIYHVRITYSGNPASCLNQVLDYEINSGNTTPHAGNDNAVSYCGSQGMIDLTTLLTGTFDPLGVWSETTASGMLTDHSWDSSDMLGTYQFKYTVSGSCSTSDEALIVITIKTIPEIPVASADPILCESQNIHLFATTIANGTYNWSGPNGFVSTEQNPILNTASVNDNGTYTVTASLNGCQSGNSGVEVMVNPLPVFDLNQSCVGKGYQLWYTSLNEASFDEANSTFTWTGPNGFSASQNPITITGGQLGVYSLTITNQYGCEATDSIDVARNICYIPNVITPNNDTSNESLDLTGFGVTRLEIYNRWGRKVYEKDDYLNEWHGQNMSGGLLPDSTYYYIIELSTEEMKQGWIQLSRG